ncbi:MAG: DUF1566 domain-containing protein, partial [Shewanella sp.]|nr:DUF1566 domain-containing protein [Shewanella sp.]
TYSDSTSSDVTSSVTWTPVDTNTATVTSAGLLSGVEVGTTTLTATKDGVTSNTVNVDVTAAVITDIQVTPALVSMAKGQTEQLTATATYSDGTSSPVTNSVTWTPVDTATATVTPAGVLSGGEVGSTTVTATKDGVTSNRVDVTVTAAVITDITVTPSPVSVAKGQTQQLTATVTYNDSTSSDETSSVTWTPVDTATATVTPAGLLSGVEIGSTTVTATKDGITSNAVDVTVTAAVITDIQVTPSFMGVVKGRTQQLTAAATYSDSTSSDETSSVTWTPLDTATATVTPAGLLSGVEVGTTTLTATKDGVTSNTVNVTVCSDLAGACIDIVDSGSGKLFTSSPSKAYLDSLGGSTTDGIDNEDGSFGPTGDFYQFSWDNAKALCTTYNTQNIGGRKNWRLPTRDELTVKLFGAFGDMFNARGWPTISYYWSATANGSNYDGVILHSGDITQYSPNSTLYTSCVSDDDVNNDLAGESIDILDTGGGKLFTNSPSKAYLDSIGGSTTDDIDAEDGDFGPVGDFYIFEWNNAKALCATYNTQNIGGRNNWRLPTRGELRKELFDVYGSMYKVRGWPTSYDYWSATANGSNYDAVHLYYGYVSDYSPSDTRYVSCVSDPVSDLAGERIDIVDTGSGKLFTNSPSVVYLRSIGGSTTDDIVTETGSTGPAGNFYLFTWNNANTLCATYNTQSIGGRTNWRLPTRDELRNELFGALGNMFTSRGWPTFFDYWSATANGSNYDTVYLYTGVNSDYSPSFELYVSCVSEP